jgi:hypothetical protein
MLNMIPLTIDLAKLPETERRTLCAEAVRRGVPLEQLIREAMIDAAQKTVTDAAEQRHAA